MKVSIHLQSMSQRIHIIIRSLLAAVVVLSVFTAYPSAAQTHGPKPVIYFDLGQVLINTTDFNRLQYIDGAYRYLGQLRRLGFRVSLITNVPDKWGANQNLKIETLKATVAKGWQDPRPFHWTQFEKIHVPLNDLYRKPHPAMFLEALRDGHDCQPIYMGEELVEIQAAERVGFRGYLVGRPGAPKFMPLHLLTCRRPL